MNDNKKRYQGKEWEKGLYYGTKSESVAPEYKCYC